jgi:hypothetical protein
MTKICRTCNQEKPLTEFSVLTTKKKSGIKYNCDCKICRSEVRREKSRQLKAKAIQYKGGKCNDCLMVVHQAAFEFHHLNPSTKEKDPTHLLRDSNEMSNSAKQELDKCVLLCANCHRIRHFSDLI